MKSKLIDLIVQPGGPLRGHVCVPGDKSISHRALLLSAIAEGEEPAIEDVEAGLQQLVKDIQYRNKLVCIADRSQGGWHTVSEYQNG